MTPGQWPITGDAGDQATLHAHATAVLARYGRVPWFTGGGRQSPPLEPPVPAELGDALSTTVVVAAISDTVAAQDDSAVTALHDRLDRGWVPESADDLAHQLRSAKLPREHVRTVARQLAERGRRLRPVAVGIILLGLFGDDRDRQLLLTVGALGDLTLYAAVALANSQPDPERAVYELACRVDGWARVHTAQRLIGTQDQQIRDWLLLIGFRNNVMTPHLAYIAATTADLRSALRTEPVEDELLDSAADILDALITGGPTLDIRHYPDAVPVLTRFATLIPAAAPSAARIRSIGAITRFLNAPPPDLHWPPDTITYLADRYSTLSQLPEWSEPTADTAWTEPSGEYGLRPRAARRAAESDTRGQSPQAKRLSNGYATTARPTGHTDPALEITLSAGFPTDCEADVRAVTRILPPNHHPITAHGFSLDVDGERLAIPYRLYLPEPAEPSINQLSPTQRTILHCLYSRHSNGYVRHRHLQALLHHTDPWVPPYVVRLVGEYVLDIVLDIQHGLTDIVTVDTAHHHIYGRFAATNPEFMFTTSQQVTSYWHRYYRNRYPCDYYPGRIILNELAEAAAAHPARNLRR